MKIIIIFVASAVLLSLAVIVVSSSHQGCSAAYSATGSCYSIDTITIHGVDHEFIIKKHSQYFNGFTHSPECPCLKKKGE